MNRLEWLALLLAAAAVIVQVFLPPVVGLANNGDFPKVIGQFNLGNPSADQDAFRFADLRHVIDPKYHYDARFYTSEILLCATALGLNSVSLNSDIFDMRVMGAVHAGLFFVAFYRFLPLVRPFKPAIRFSILFLIVFFFTDVMYVSYFNSFYMDAGALLFLFLAVVSFLRALHWHMPVDRWLLVLWTVFLVTSKAQHFTLGIPIALFLAWKGGLLTPGRGLWFRTLSATIVLAASAFSAIRGTPSYYPALGSYTVIFFELLPKSKNVPGDLRELGLDESYQKFVGTHAYSANAGMRDPQFEEAFKQKGSYGRVGKFLLMHPTRALSMTLTRLDNAGRQRPRIGNFDRSTGVPPATQSHTFALWSGIKAYLFAEHGWRYLLYALTLSLFVAIFAIARTESLPAGIPAAICVLAAMTLLELTVTSFADALDSERHFSLFSALTDLLLTTGVALLAATAKRPSRPMGLGG